MDTYQNNHNHATEMTQKRLQSTQFWNKQTNKQTFTKFIFFLTVIRLMN